MKGIMERVTSVSNQENVNATTIAAMEREVNWMRIPSLDCREIRTCLPTIEWYVEEGPMSSHKALRKCSTACTG
jgi:hypothetical protein